MNQLATLVRIGLVAQRIQGLRAGGLDPARTLGLQAFFLLPADLPDAATAAPAARLTAGAIEAPAFSCAPKRPAPLPPQAHVGDFTYRRALGGVAGAAEGGNRRCHQLGSHADHAWTAMSMASVSSSQ